MNESSIKEFRGQYFFLSNFYYAPIKDKNGRVFPTVEHYFQYIKVCKGYGPRELALFWNLNSSPADAKMLGRRLNMRADWEDIKLRVMEEALLLKFTQHEDLKRLLLETGNAWLEEGNNWNDTYWGVSLMTGRGANHLGKLLMKVRETLRRCSATE